MKVIFLTLVHISNIEERGIYQDLMKRFRDDGHQVYIITPCERRLGMKTSLCECNGVNILNVRTLNIQKTSILEKGIGTLLLENQYRVAIMRHLNGIPFDLITYSTPPITLTNVVKFLKRKNPDALSYLQLKDIFPQNAVDIGLISRTGMKSVLYRLFRRKETKLYRYSDYIGCMSPANVDYVLKHNLEIPPERVEVAPNSIDMRRLLIMPEQTKTERESIRKQYGLPNEKPVFIYGGNLGKPQGIPFLIQCLEANAHREDCYFVIIGNGTELPRLRSWFDKRNPLNVTVMNGLPKQEYDELVRACDVGLIFLDHRFTIPNYPSRLLSYLENKMPVLCATDPITDIGRIAEDNGYGYWCESDSVEAFTHIVDKMIHSDRKEMGEKGYDFLKKNYMVENTYNAIMAHVKSENRR